MNGSERHERDALEDFDYHFQVMLAREDEHLEKLLDREAEIIDLQDARLRRRSGGPTTSMAKENPYRKKRKGNGREKRGILRGLR